MSNEVQETMDGSPCKVELTPNALQQALREEGDHGFIKFQCGPIADNGKNGTTIEHVADVLVKRLEGFQNGPFACAENEAAIINFRAGRDALLKRTALRQAQGVEGVNAAHTS